MAELYTPEEIQEIFDRYNAELMRTGRVTEAMAREFADATKGVKNYTLTLKENLRQLGQASKQAAQDMADGAKGTELFSKSIEATGAVSQTVVSQFGKFGKALGAVIGALTWFATSALKQSDRLFNSFQDISRSGAVGGQAMTDVFNSMKSFGYTINELDKMAALLSENSRDLALFGGTAATGGKRLAVMVEGFRDLRVNFQALGLSTDEQVRAAAGYYRQMGRLGRATDATSAGAVAYIKEMETLTRLTGLQRKEIENVLEQAEAENNFYAEWEDLSAESQAATKEVLAAFKQLDPSGRSVKGLVQSFSGLMIGAEEQSELFYASGGRLFELIEGLKAGTITATQFKQAMGVAADENYSTAKAMSMYNSTMFGSLRNLKMLGQTGQNAEKSLGDVTTEINQLIKGTDGATKAQAGARVNQIDMSNNIQSLINLGVSPLTKAFEILTRVVERLTRFLDPKGRDKAKYEQETREQVAETAAKVSGGIIDKIIQAESGGRNIGNLEGRSSAYGIGQITKGTFEGLVKQSSPGSALHGKTFEDMKANVDLQRQALSMLTTQNQAALKQSGIEVTDAATYLAHHFGAGTAKRLLTASDQTPIGQVVSDRDRESNPNVFKNISTVGDLKAWAERKMGTAGPSGAFGFRGTMSGPMSGYSPGLGALAHGYEEFSIRPMGGTTNSNSGASEGTMIKLIERVDDLISLNRNQLDVSERILKYQQ
jgi:hypothetical protein